MDIEEKLSKFIGRLYYLERLLDHIDNDDKEDCSEFLEKLDKFLDESEYVLDEIEDKI